MRILLFSSSYAPRTGGLETVTRRLAGELAERGHQVTVATNRYPRSLPRRERIDGIEVRRQLYPGILASRQRRTKSQRLKGLLLLPMAPLAFLRLLFATWRCRPDVINVHYLSNPAIYMLAVARVLRVPAVLSFHGSDLSTGPFPTNTDRVVRRACHMAGAITTCSEDLRGYLHQVLPASDQAKTIVAHNGVDVMASTAPSPIAGPYLLLVARLVEKKGVDIAIRSMQLLRERGVNVPLVIAGDGPLRAELEALAKQLGVAEQVQFLGAVPVETVRALIRDSLLVVVPSRWEAFGVVCLEAMVAGKSVVASRCGGIPEIVVERETGLLMQPGNPDDLAVCIAELLRDRARARQMGQQGRERAFHEFSWARTTESYLAAYQHALPGPDRGSVADRDDRVPAAPVLRRNP